MNLSVPSFSRLVGLAVAVWVVGALGGCALWRGSCGVEAPPGWARRGDAARLADPATRRDAYRDLFPERPNLKCSGALSAAGRWSAGEAYCEWMLFATDAEHLRLRGFQKTQLWFDLIVVGDRMTFLMHPERVAYRGTVGIEGSPFGDRFGIEPGDLIRALTIGEAVAEGRLSGSGEASRLTPADSASSAVQWLDLDEATGLPCRARGRRGDARWEVRYRAWQIWNGDGSTPQERLAPRRIEIRRLGFSGARLRVNMDHWYLGRPTPTGIFDDTPPRGWRIEPLEALERLF